MEVVGLKIMRDEGRGLAIAGGRDRVSPLREGGILHHKKSLHDDPLRGLGKLQCPGKSGCYSPSDSR